MQAGSVDSELQDMSEGDWSIAASRTEKSCGVLNSSKRVSRGAASWCGS